MGRSFKTEITDEPKILSVFRVLRGKDRFMSTPEQNDEEVSLTDFQENTGFNGAELSESVLGHDWNSPDEDAAWSNL